jgi:DNA-binding transcriptional LysR family regulator
MFRKGHHLDKRRIMLDEFSEADHVVVVSTGTGHGKVDKLLERGGVQRRVRPMVPHFVAVGHILHTTDMIATVPERFAQQVAGPFDLGYPVALPEIAINLVWHAKYHKDPANQWPRGLVFKLHASDK